MCVSFLNFFLRVCVRACDTEYLVTFFVFVLRTILLLCGITH